MIKEVWFGECEKLLKNIPELYVDAVITDPPYNIARKNNFNTMGRAGLDFGDWDKGADIFSYMAKCARILKKDGSLIIFNDWKNLGDIARVGEAYSFAVKDMLRLEKSNPMPRNRDRRYVTDYECAVWLTMPKAKWVFNRQEDGYQRPKFVCSIDKGLHPTQKPLKLMEEIIKIHTNPGQLIVDCFAGSGTTLLAAKNLGRQFIGIEKDPIYYKTILKRLFASND